MRHPVSSLRRTLAAAAVLLTAWVADTTTAEIAETETRFPVEVQVALSPEGAVPADSPHLRIQRRSTTSLTATVDAVGFRSLTDAGLVTTVLPAWQPGRGSGYLTYAELGPTLATWAAARPDLAQLLSVGTSVQGRDLWAMRITAGIAAAPVRPEFRLVGGMHGDEPVGVEAALRLIRALIAEYGVTPQVTRLVDTTDIYVVPLLNPDGYAAPVPKRNNCSSDAGVDLNRDFPTPGEADTTAGRAPETAAVMTWTGTRRFSLAMNLHGGSLGAVYPWGYAHDFTSVTAQNPETPLLRLLALTYTAGHAGMWAVADGGWVHGTINGCQWYATNGGELADWQYRAHGCVELTLELSEDKAPATAGPEQPFPVWTAHRASLLGYIESIHGGVRGRVLRDDGVPVAAQVGVGVRGGSNRGAGAPRVSCQLRLEKGWNLIALPFRPDQPVPDLLFPGKWGPCWTWTGEQYAVVAAFQPGLAAWVLNPGAATTVTIAGTLETGAALALRKGWALAGALGRAFLPPADQISGTYAWNNSAQAYVSVAAGTRLDPLTGYWFCVPAAVTVSLAEPANAPAFSTSDAATGAFFRVLEAGRYPLWFADTTAAAIQHVAPAPVAAGDPVELTATFTSPAEPLQLFGATVPPGSGPDGLPARWEQTVVLARATSRCDLIWSGDAGSTWRRVAMVSAHDAEKNVRSTVVTVAGQADVRYCFELYRNGEPVAWLGSEAAPCVLTLTRGAGVVTPVRGNSITRRYYGMKSWLGKRRAHRSRPDSHRIGR